jgi:2-iminobutanoate/2-iminopropanoate deaminase
MRDYRRPSMSEQPGRPRQPRQVIQSPHAPKALGPYSHAVRSGGLVFTSGQIPLDPETGKLVDGPIDAQARRVMENLGAVLGAAGTSFTHVVKTTIYLTNLADFSAVNAVYGTYFPSDPPARSTVQVAALPLGAAIEIEAVAEVS